MLLDKLSHLLDQVPGLYMGVGAWWVGGGVFYEGDFLHMLLDKTSHLLDQVPGLYMGVGVWQAGWGGGLLRGRFLTHAPG